MSKSSWQRRAQCAVIAFIVLNVFSVFWLSSHSIANTNVPNHPLESSLQSQPQSLRQGLSSSTSEQNNFLPKVLVIYFPQYHPDPLNNKLWGEGFTDWDNLKKAPEKNKQGFPIPRPLPYDPNTPTQLLGPNEQGGKGLGYYDLRSKEIRERQSELARLHNIDGFIYHHYWFYDPSHPGPNLHAPLMEMLNDGYPNLPFFLNWCAVKWINVWMGRPIFQAKDAPINKNKALLLQDQFFNATQDQIRDHYIWLRQFFHHENYIKVRGEPVFFTYQWDPQLVPIVESLRKFAIEDGFPNLYLVIGRGGPPLHIHDPSGLDERLLKLIQRKNQPVDWFPVDVFNQTMLYPYPSEYIDKPLSLPQWCHPNNNNLDNIPSYPQPRNKPEINGIPMTFDNTPRRDFKVADQWNYGKPNDVVSRFKSSLKTALAFDSCCWPSSHRTLHNEERFVAINAWNEWAEGMTMEPSDVFGTKFLEAVKEAKEEVGRLQNNLREDGKCNLNHVDNLIFGSQS